MPCLISIGIEYWSRTASMERSEEHTSELQSRQYLHSFPTRRSSDLIRVERGLAEQVVQILGERLFLLRVLLRLARPGPEDEFGVPEFVGAEKLADAVLDQHRDRVLEPHRLDGEIGRAHV